MWKKFRWKPPLISNPLPIDFTGGFPLQEQFYLDAQTYQDPTIQVSITEKDITDYLQGYRGRDAQAWIVDIKIGDASQLRTAAAESFETTTTRHVDVIADRLIAVVAFNGDYVTGRTGAMCSARVFPTGINCRASRTCCSLTRTEDFHPMHLPKKGELSDTIDGKKVINAFCFGPILVENGEIVEKIQGLWLSETGEKLCPPWPSANAVLCTIKSF